eukprot:RCo050769
MAAPRPSWNASGVRWRPFPSSSELVVPPQLEGSLEGVGHHQSLVEREGQRQMDGVAMLGMMHQSGGMDLSCRCFRFHCSCCCGRCTKNTQSVHCLDCCTEHAAEPGPATAPPCIPIGHTPRDDFQIECFGGYRASL